MYQVIGSMFGKRYISYRIVELTYEQAKCCTHNIHLTGKINKQSKRKENWIFQFINLSNRWTFPKQKKGSSTGIY